MAADRLLGFRVLLCYFLLLISAAEETDFREKCPRPFDCGILGEIHFPLPNPRNSEHLPIRRCDGKGAAQKVRLENHTWYQIGSINHEIESNPFFIRYPDFKKLLPSRDGSASNYNVNAWATIIPVHSPVMRFSILNNITFFGCNPNSNDTEAKNMFKCKSPHPDGIYFRSEHDDGKLPIFPYACLLAQLLIEQLPNSTYPRTFLISFPEIRVKLSESREEIFYCERGQCQPDKQNACVLDWGPFPPHPPPSPPLPPPPSAAADSKGKERYLKGMLTGLSIGLAGAITIALFVILFLYKRSHKSSGVQNQPRNTYPGPCRNTANPESGAIYFGVPVFSYEELQEATNNFDQTRELGEGGFGTVYYGKLRDGREVAVKRLYERNYRPVESFINEIQNLTRLRHRNLVSLYGCTSRHSRELLLVYEYIPNGTVSCHLHGNQAKPGLLPWPVRIKIAIETASALTYLHASDIIHRDVKTSNILLDNNFCVKVADFGLSRLFPNDATHVSTAPRGTPGYVDPDYRLCYQLTSKSDVYSFGVVLVELISSLPAVDVTRDRDEIKLANLAIRKIQNRAFCELVDPSLGFQSDDKIKRMITSMAKLAFQCLQGDKELRPSMAEVLEMLERIESGKNELGNLEGIDAHGAQVSHSYVHPLLQNSQMKPQRLHQTF